MHVRELIRNEEGMVTVESAYALAGLLLIFLLCLGGLSAALVQMRVTDSAHMVARAVARGVTRAEAESYLAPTMASTVRENEDSVEVVVQQRAPLLPLTLTGRATFPREKITHEDTHAAPGQAQLVSDKR